MKIPAKIIDLCFARRWHINVCNHHANNLAKLSKETFKDKLSGSILLLSRCMMTNNITPCSFLHVHFTEPMEVVENMLFVFFTRKLMVKTHLLKRQVESNY